MADVRMVEALGREIHVFFSIDAPTASAGALATAASETEVGLLTREAHGSIARLDPRPGVRPGQRITFHVDPGLGGRPPLDSVRPLTPAGPDPTVLSN